MVNPNKVSHYRLKKGITQKKLSELTGINIRQIQKYESGEYAIEKISLKNAILIADALNCDVKNLL